jgi:hypothetical protein
MSNSSLKLLQIGPWYSLSVDLNLKCIPKKALIYHKLEIIGGNKGNFFVNDAC